MVAEQARLLDQQATQIQTLTGQVRALTGQVKALTRHLGQNPGNSSLPPSTDRGRGPSRQRRGSSRKPGKQPDAAPLEIVTDPDEVMDHLPAACGGCGADLGDAATALTVVHHVRDVPLTQVKVVEHRLHCRARRCGTVSAAAAPTGVDDPAVYGPNLRAVAVYLVVDQHVPVERAAQLIVDLPGAAPSTGWVSAQVARAADALVDVEKLIDQGPNHAGRGDRRRRDQHEHRRQIRVFARGPGRHVDRLPPPRKPWPGRGQRVRHDARVHRHRGA
ncbi:MAG TPA: hypothetical protein VIU87_10305 [Mycobacterium sp.]